ncbi:hypothetical protein LRS74_33245 [Streptomyces sp. LX-29]|uniref:TOTE conflict system archaeo-eukaryotic primase domain-containing protein n=1 Tax=Streptomyces sp. LX-29 TaxID=2900152 RepID=UPI00240DEB30|nr:hypothetical protein [Streptomyces sp. LX-29]WFB11354.1 hypothetical protein LRS74_33245 [Streptomyces sp. LX-29]
MPTARVPQALPSVPEPLAPTVVEGEGGLPYADATTGTEAKVALFRALFAGREDVYATRWVSAKSGRTGWSPAEDNPFAKNKNDAERVFWLLTDGAVYNHLARPEPGSRETHLGLYPLLADDTCRLLAVDFDGKDGSDWRGNAAAYASACEDAGVPALVELSRSGAGAHVWSFFPAPVAAVTARTLGMALLRRAIDVCGQMTLCSHDRLFPAQDLIPTNAKGNARFGNLIALPLQGASRLKGTTVFCDPRNWEPYPDQFAHLSQVERLSLPPVEALSDKIGEVKAGPSAIAPVLPPSRGGALWARPPTSSRRGCRRCSLSPRRGCRLPCSPRSSTRRRSTSLSSFCSVTEGSPVNAVTWTAVV